MAAAIIAGKVFYDIRYNRCPFFKYREITVLKKQNSFSAYPTVILWN